MDVAGAKGEKRKEKKTPGRRPDSGIFCVQGVISLKMKNMTFTQAPI